MMGIPVTMALIVVRFYFEVPFRGSAWLLVVASAACLLCGIGLGTVVGTAIYNMLFEPVFQRAGSMADIMLRYLKLRR